MPLRAAELLVGVGADIRGAMSGLDRVGWRMGILGRQGDEFSGKFARTGAALSGIGLAVGGVGAAGVAFFTSATKAASDFNQAAALTLTQVDQTGVRLEDIKRISKEVARSIPAPFEQLQASLYDIFSSMDVSVEQSRGLLEQFAKAAVAGQTDVQTAGRSTIALMNAYHIPIEKTSEVMDFQFQLVRKGVGTYEEFARTIGRAIPSAVRAGQTYQSLGGVLAFLTRSGLSTAMAAASAGRAFDAISKTKVGERLEKMGIATRDASGEFRQINDIMTDMGRRMANLTAPERADALEKLFKGSGGTIQARRFFDLAVTGFDDLNKRVGEMQNSAGAMGAAYKIMFEQPQSQMQLFKNNWAALKTEIGDVFLPILNKVIGGFRKLVDWFSNLDPNVRKNIVITAALGAAFAVISGIVLVVVGVLLSLVAVLTSIGLTVGVAALALGGLLAALLLIPLGIFLIVKHWDTLKEKLGPVIDMFKLAFTWIGKNLKGAFEDLKPLLKFVGVILGGVILIALGAVVAAITAATFVLRGITMAFRWLTDIIGKGFKAVAEWLPGALDKIAEFFLNVGRSISDAWKGFISFFTELPGKAAAWFTSMKDAVTGWITDTATAVGEWITTTWGKVVTFFTELPGKIFDWVMQIPERIAFAFGVLIGLWIGTFNNIFDFVTETLPKIIGKIIEFLMELPGKAWEWLKQTWDKFTEWGAGVIDSVTQWGRDTWNSMLAFFVALPGRVWTWLKETWRKWDNWVDETKVTVWNGIKAAVDSVISFVMGLPDRAWHWLKQVAGKFAEGIKNARDEAVTWGGKVVKAFGDMVGDIWDWIKDLPRKLLEKAKSIGSSFVKGIKAGLQMTSPSLPERIFAGIAKSAMDSTVVARKEMQNLRNIMGGTSGMLNPIGTLGPMSTMPSGREATAFTPTAAPTTTGPAVNIENLNVTSMRPEEISKDISAELAWTMRVVG